MYSKFHLLSKFISYYFRASNSRGHGMHSPFVFDFITKVLNDRSPYEAYDRVEALRSRLLKDQQVLQVEDMGAGSVTDKSGQRRVASIAGNAAKPRKWGQLLYRMVNYYQPQGIIELGSSLGITSSYLATGNPAGKLITLEGAKEVAAVAQRNFQTLGLNNVELRTGHFDDTLNPALKDLPTLDFGFIDGNHREEPTLRYFNELAGNAHNNTILVFDDIHWSREMENAWHIIRQDDRVTSTIDLFFIGIVLFRKEFREKQHFSIRFQVSHNSFTAF